MLTDTISDISVDLNDDSCVAYSSYGVTFGQTNTGQLNIVVFKLDTNGNLK